MNVCVHPAYKHNLIANIDQSLVSNAIYLNVFQRCYYTSLLLVW